VILVHLNGGECCHNLRVLFALFGNRINANVLGERDELLDEDTSLMCCCDSFYVGKNEKGGLEIMRCILENAERETIESVLAFNNVCFCD